MVDTRARNAPGRLGGDGADPRAGDADDPGAEHKGHTPEARLVAGITFKELLRRPGGWVATMLTGVLFALLIAALGFSGERLQDKIEDRTFKIVASGDLDGAREILARLEETPRLKIERNDAAEAGVTESRYLAGVVFPPGADAKLARQERIDVDMYVRGSQNQSVEAFNTLGVELQKIELAELARLRGHDVETGEGLTVSMVELPRDSRINRVLLARQLAPIAALLCIGIVTSVGSVFGAARDRRSLEPLLVLPLRRSSIALGIASGAYPLSCLQVVAAVTLLVLTAALPGSISHQPPLTLAAMLAAALFTSLLLALVATAVGCIAGALGSGSDDAVSVGDFLSIAFVAAGVLVYVSPTIGGTAISYAIPILGQVLLMRDLVSGTIDPLGVLVGCASAVAVFAWAVRFSGRRLDEEKRLARAMR